MNIKLTQKKRDNLKQLHKNCYKRKHADKLKTLLLLDDDTIRKYRNQYLNYGANSLLGDNNKGTSSYLSEDELESLDNAKYYHALVVKEFLEDNSRIILHFLPAYSPNLNIIERLWKILKKKVVYNKFYLKFADFKFAVNDFFKNEVWKQKEFENLLIDNFQIIKPDFSGSYLQ